MCDGKTSSSGGLIGKALSGIGSTLFGSGETTQEKDTMKQICSTYGGALQDAYDNKISLWKYMPYMIGIIVIIFVILYLKNKT